MKKLLSLLTLSVFLFTSCSTDGERGPQGPIGPEGPPGADGLIGIVYDVPAVDFTEDNEYGVEIAYEDFTDEEVFESDVVLVYLRTGQDGEADGEPVYVWRLLPQTYYVDGGTMQYNYDYTFFSTFIFLDADVELSSLGTAFTDDQYFRIAIVPAAFAESNDVSNYSEVMKALQVEQRDIPQLDLDQ